MTFTHSHTTTSESTLVNTSVQQYTHITHIIQTIKTKHTDFIQGNKCISPKWCTRVCTDLPYQCFHHRFPWWCWTDLTPSKVHWTCCQSTCTAHRQLRLKPYQIMSQCLKYIVSYIHCRFIVNCAWTILKQQFTRCKGFRTHPNFSAGEVIQHKACHHTDFSASTRQLSPRCILSLSWARCCAVIVTVIASLQSAISMHQGILISSMYQLDSIPPLDQNDWKTWALTLQKPVVKHDKVWSPLGWLTFK